MENLIDLPYDEARKHFLKGSSYFSHDVPEYLSFEPILKKVTKLLNDGTYKDHGGHQKQRNNKPENYSGVNYSLLSNKDGRFAWRPYELIHPVIYVSLVNTVCQPENWGLLQRRFHEFENVVVECCSWPVRTTEGGKDAGTQVKSWWIKVEQQSLKHSLEYSHVLHTDVVNCYGSLYTHSIPWAIYGLDNAKKNRSEKLLGNKIDKLIQASRYGQTNGIPQGSILMDFIAEIVLGYVDELIAKELTPSEKQSKVTKSGFHVLRYRDDYRIFSNDDSTAEKVLQVISEKLRLVGMRLGVPKTHLDSNVVESSIKADKLAGISLQDLGETNAKTIQKQLLRLHSFGQRFPNSGALRRLISEYQKKIANQRDAPDDLEVQIAIATDIGYVSPAAFPGVAVILSNLIALAQEDERAYLWGKVRDKMKRMPHNGYLEIWLQRIIQPNGIEFESDERLCQIANGDNPDIWENKWLGEGDLSTVLDTEKIRIKDPKDLNRVMQPEEVALFTENAWMY